MKYTGMEISKQSIQLKLKPEMYCRGTQWTKGIGSGPIGVGLRGFESRPLPLPVL